MKTSSDAKIDCRNRKSDLELTKDKGLINFGEHFFSDPGQLPRAVGAFMAISIILNRFLIFNDFFLPFLMILASGAELILGYA